MNASDLSAKLLAQENLTIIRSNSKTAWFDVGARVLSIPLWKDMTPEIEGMFIGHEVGHALFTSKDDWTKALDSLEPKRRGTMKGYYNVVEDARIEKLMKRRYPGLRKSMYAGYKQLLQRDFFRIDGKDVNELQLIDRINLYFKAGMTLGIKFTPEEKVLVNLVDNAETFDEVVDIATKIFEFAKDTKSKRQDMLQDFDLKFDDEDEGDADEDFDEDAYDSYESDDHTREMKASEEEEETQKQTPSDESQQTGDGQGDEDSDLQSETDKALNERLEDMADTTVKYEYMNVVQRPMHEPIISYKRVIAETGDIESYQAEQAPNHAADFKKFMTESDRVVSYLVKEFEMRKSAQAYRRAQTAKSGSLNLNKLHSYKLTDDIFRRITTIPDGKNHGMIFLLDWSGSMDTVIQPTIKQLINLVMFCRRINIPFEVYAFSGSYGSSLHRTEEEATTFNSVTRSLQSITDKVITFSDGYYHLLNLFSSKMSNTEFQTVARRFTTGHFNWVRGYSLGDTPLNDALSYMLKHIPEYKRSNNIEKLTFVTLTDGAGGSLYQSGNSSRYKPEFNDEGIRIKTKTFINDELTGQNYEFDNCSTEMTKILLRMIKQRYDVTTVGFYICENRRNSLYQAIRDNAGTVSVGIEEMRLNFRNQGFYSMRNTGRDELFIVPNSSTKIIDEELEVDSSASAAAIARKFGKQFTTKKTSRVLLDKFIGHVA